MSRKGKKTANTERKLVMKLHNNCILLGEISQNVERPRSTVQAIIDRHYKINAIQNMPVSECPQKF